jgi:hypothetical protein
VPKHDTCRGLQGKQNAHASSPHRLIPALPPAEHLL